MPSTLEQLSPTRVKLTIDMPFAELQPAIDESYKEISKQVNIPGFRKGKVPPRLIDQRFGRGVVLQEAINQVLPQAYGQAVTEHELRPLGQPEIDIAELNDGQNVVFTAEVDVRPEFDLPDLSKVKVDVTNAEVTDEQVNERVELLRERFGTLTDVDRAAAEGDVVTLNLTASQDGQVLDEAEANDVQYKVGAGGMVDGLDEALVGMKADETKTFTSTLVGGPHRDETAEIEVTVTKVQNQELPEVDDEFAQLVSEFDTADEMLADLRSNLERMARIDQANQAREHVLKAVVDATEFELPEALVAGEQTARRENIENQLNRAGLTLEQYLADSEDEPDTAEEFWNDIDTRVVEGLRSQIILDKYAEDNELEVSQQELTELIFAKAQQNGSTPEQEIQHMMEHDHVAEWMGEVRRGKALGELVSAATVSDADGNVIDLRRLNSDGTLAEPTEDEAAEESAKPKAKKTPAKPKKAAEPKADADQAKADDEKPAAKPLARKAKAESAESADEKPALKRASKTKSADSAASAKSAE